MSRCFYKVIDNIQSYFEYGVNFIDVEEMNYFRDLRFIFQWVLCFKVMIM